MKTTTEQKLIISHDEITKAAYQIWQQDGCQQGRDLEYWLMAERQLLAASPQGNGQTNNAVARATPHRQEKQRERIRA